MDPATIAIVGTLVGGPVAVKIVDWFLNIGKTQYDNAKSMRDELRLEAEAIKKDAALLREEIRTVEKDLDMWKEKYFILLGVHLELKVKCNEQHGGFLTGGEQE